MIYEGRESRPGLSLSGPTAAGTAAGRKCSLHRESRNKGFKKKGSVVPKTYFNSEVLEYLGDKISNSPTPVSEETGTT